MTQVEPTKGADAPDPGGTAADEPRPRTDWTIFAVAGGVVGVFLLWGLIGPDSLSGAVSALLDGLMRGGGWAFILAATAFVVFALWLAFSKFGKIRLGTDAEKPEFRTVSWIAMMFSAGMGIGLMFFGVNEPLSFFTTSTPPGAAEPLTPDAANVAMATSLFHWTLHPWAIYAVVGLAIAYSTFRKGRRQLISQAFIPLIGKKAAEGGVGKAIDILAIFATLFGSAASLGLGAYQIGGGMQSVGWTDGAPGAGILAIIIVVLTAAFILSAVSGVARGIQWLSNINMVLAGVLALFVFVLGPTVIILDLIPTAVGAYFTDFFEMVGRTEASGGEPMLDWLSSWTVFYWAWWISWTPFVGMFLARISRGRTIREFVGGVILAPSMVSLVWFCIFGGAAITQAKPVADGGDGRVFSEDSNAQLFEVLQAYPLATITGLLVMILVGIFFVSGADAASIVMGTLSQRGTIEPSRWIVVFWGSIMGAVAVLMLVTGGEDALSGIQNLTILVAAPFVVIMILLCFALSKDLRRDPMILRDVKGAEIIEQAVDYATARHGTDFYLRVRAFPDGKKAELTAEEYDANHGPGTGPGYQMTEPGETEEVVAAEDGPDADGSSPDTSGGSKAPVAGD
ncbi:BCCT family transporter [Pseudonocardia endophytica]|uniref:Choline/carnitine/betaine transport n=1 Tax=Pseudonocardia endophytica TaxID=401976 RepID=A0A4R1HMR1_PSEEN|nr:BCCT family transporter [Pseudonocardia endophytica]TCK21620.1 choline/carnitine/betaine transport [Pseudonocardia endophytica]